MLRMEGGMRAILAPWRAAGDDEEDGIGIAWQKTVLGEGVGLARLLLNQAGARVRACTGAVRLVLIDSSPSPSASKTTTCTSPARESEPEPEPPFESRASAAANRREPASKVAVSA
jgi:hypothetical protein